MWQGLELKTKPCQIFVTKLAGLEEKVDKVFGLKCKPGYQQSLFAPGHITGHLCICAHGTILPSIIIFEKSLRIQHVALVFLVSGCMGSRSLAI